MEPSLPDDALNADMAKGPAVVVVARHGARLDAADKAWHLSSPTPYDPPLTYGGWAQGKALGQRIAALLHQRDMERACDRQPQKKRKKRKIVIHSSPFLRCVQTSTAVAAGITQYESLPPATPPPPSTAKAPAPSSRATPPLVQPLFDPALEISYKPRAGPDRILLRVDAFLGEWLSPDYYQDITPPPSSTMMVAGAKADLLRRGDQIQEMAASSSVGHFPGGWGGGRKLGAANRSTVSPTKHSSLAHVAALRERSSSDASSTLTLQRGVSKEAITSASQSTHVPAPGRAYDPPAPSYSVAPSDPIPRGYVAHAQDACIQVDFQWDSMRPPQDWGDGGEYGDEWSTMHKRFRRGMAGMMQWYGVHGAEPPKEHSPGFMFKVLSNKPSPPPMSRTGADHASDANGPVDAKDEEELVLILVTHGAGCNALLGAMSNQPVLMDVGLASLSMAVRTEAPSQSPSCSGDERRLSVADPGMWETYEMKHLASVDHLRPGVDPAQPPQAPSQSQSPAIAPSPSSDYRRRVAGFPTISNRIGPPCSLADPHKSSTSSLDSVRRTTSTGPRSMYSSHLSSTNGGSAPTGLWAGARKAVNDAGCQGTPNPGPDMMLNIAPSPPLKPKPALAAERVPPLDGAAETPHLLVKMDSKEERETGDRVAPLFTAHDRKSNPASSGGLWSAKSQPKTVQGLWGPPRLDDVYEHGRGPKRRWTMTEREESL